MEKNCLRTMQEKWQEYLCAGRRMIKSVIIPGTEQMRILNQFGIIGMEGGIIA